jgi:hypothetical protein
MSQYFDIEIEASETANESVFKQIASQIKPDWTDPNEIEIKVCNRKIKPKKLESSLTLLGNHRQCMGFRLYPAAYALCIT